MKIIVLAGGLSTERDVSLTSSAGICRTLRERGHKAVLLDVFLGLPGAPENLAEVFDLPDGNLSAANGIRTSEPDLEAIKASRADKSDCFFGPNVIELCRMADITFLGLHGGYGEDGRLQAAFDLLGIRYTGPNSLGCALAMDKRVTKQIFMANKIPTPKGHWLLKTDKERSLKALGLTLPVVVKPCSGGSSIGVFICNTEEEYLSALDHAFCYDDCQIIEEYVKGKELTCGIIDGEALPIVEIIPKNGWFDYANKYQADCTEEICPARISEELTAKIQEAAVRAFKALQLNVYSRADFLLNDKGEIFCLEVNTLPGMTAASLLPKEAAAAGIPYGDLCELIIKKSMEARYL